MNLYILNTIGVGVDTLRAVSRQCPIKGIISLSASANTQSISDYVPQNELTKQLGIEHIELDKYSMSSDGDKEKLLALDIDILAVVGWQRLVPEWLISHCKLGVIGIHGSPDGITGGRGRSPQNWSLILGKETFSVSIFKIDSGVDSGDVIDTRIFPLSPFDDIKTSYYKVSCLAADMISECVLKNSLSKTLEKQRESEAFYLPQRLEEDGALDWRRDSIDIYNFIRALTRPYPGAYTTLDGQRVRLWKGRPFSIPMSGDSYQCGEIIRVFNKNDILVKTKDSFFLIEDYEYDGNSPLVEGALFESETYQEQISSVIDRHYKKSPDLRVVEELEKISNSSPEN